MTLAPMITLPPEDAPMREWLRPLSATAVSPRSEPHFSDRSASEKAKGVAKRNARAAQFMVQRVNRKRARKINGPRAVELRQGGWTILDIASELDVSTRAVERALKTARDNDTTRTV